MVSQHNFTAKSAAQNSSDTCVQMETITLWHQTEVIHKRDELIHKLFVKRSWIEGYRLYKI